MKKFIAVISDNAGQRSRYITASTMLAGRPSTFNTAAELPDAYLFADREEAKVAALAVIKSRVGRAFAGALNTYAIHEVGTKPLIIKTPEGERRQPETIRPTLRMSAFLEAYDGAKPKEPSPGTCSTFDWKGGGDDLYASLAAIIDAVDYTNQACRPNEAVGAVLDQVLIERAKDCLSRWRNQCYKFAATANPEAFGPSD